MTEHEHQINNPEARKILNEIGGMIADTITERLPGWGMCLFIFEFNGPSFFWISSAERASMIKALEEFIKRQKQ